MPPKRARCARCPREFVPGPDAESPPVCPSCVTQARRKGVTRGAGRVSSAAERQRREDRASDRTAESAEPAEPVQRGNPLTSVVDYSDDEREFLAAMDRYRRQNRRPFPTLAEVLAVAVSLGYRRVQAPGPLPPAPRPVGGRKGEGL
jgi:hypothetical protein